MPKRPYADLTGHIIAIYYRTFKTMQRRQGCSEQDLIEALAAELGACNLAVQTRSAAPSSSRVKVSLLVDGDIPVLVRKARCLTQQHLEQLEACLREGGWPVGLMVNFGSVRPQARRLYNPSSDQIHSR